MRASPENVHQSIDNDLLICPQVAGWRSERNSSYGYNFQFLGNARRLRESSRFVNFPVKLHRIQGDTIIAADALGTAAHFATSDRTPNRSDGTGESTALGNHAYMLDPPRLTADSDICDDEKRSAPDDRHRERASFLFADAHVAALRPEDVGYVRYDTGAYALEDEQATNRLFSGTGRNDDPPPKVP